MIRDIYCVRVKRVSVSDFAIGSCSADGWMAAVIQSGMNRGMEAELEALNEQGDALVSTNDRKHAMTYEHVAMWGEQRQCFGLRSCSEQQ